MARWFEASPLKAVLQRFANWRASSPKLDGSVSDEVLASTARDIGLGRAELKALCAEGANAADLLAGRLKGLGLQRAELARTQAAVLRELETVRSFCRSKRRCGHGISQVESRWREFCPNAQTLASLG